VVSKRNWRVEEFSVPPEVEKQRRLTRGVVEEAEMGTVSKIESRPLFWKKKSAHVLRTLKKRGLIPRRNIQGKLGNAFTRRERDLLIP